MRLSDEEVERRARKGAKKLAKLYRELCSELCPTTVEMINGVRHSSTDYRPFIRALDLAPITLAN